MLQFLFCFSGFFVFLHIRISSIFFRYFIYLFFASNIWQLVVVVIVLCIGKMRKMKCKYLRSVLYFIVFYLNIYSTELSGEYIQLKFLLLLLLFLCTLSCFCLCFLLLFLLLFYSVVQHN